MGISRGIQSGTAPPHFGELYASNIAKFHRPGLKMSNKAKISLAQLPDASQPKMDFLDSSFFRKYGFQLNLPTPEEVRVLSPVGLAQLPLVKFEQLGLVVKFGPRVTIAEAQCLWIIRHTLRDKVPVPEVYGWRVDGCGEVFVYMELISGEVLKDRWASLNDSEKTAVCARLREMIDSLREVRQDPTDPFIGSINRAAPLDIIFESKLPVGALPSVKIFNNWFSSLPQRWLPESQKYEDSYRFLLSDTGEIMLTHADLHRGNIIVSSTNPPEIVAIVDWGQAGWYPDYWEYCKAAYTSYHSGNWRNRWIPEFLDPWIDEQEAFSEYVMAMGEG